MATQPKNYYDWPAGTSNGLNVGADLITYPFLNYPTKDSTTKIYTVSRVVQKMANYVPQPALATYSGNPNAYLVDESDVQIDTLQQARNVLKYAMIPTNQAQGISRSITRPQPRSTFVTNAVTADVQPLIVQNRSTLFNIAVDGCFIGNCMVSATAQQLFAPSFTVTRTDNTFATISDTSTFNASNCIAAIPNDANTIGHMLVYPSGSWSITNGTTINLAPGSPAATGVHLIAPFLKNYAPGTPTIRTNQIESFYLPTVSAGVSTFTDIPLPSIIANDVDYFNALANNAPNLASNTITYDFDGPMVWMGPIYVVKQWKVKTSDL